MIRRRRCETQDSRSANSPTSSSSCWTSSRWRRRLPVSRPHLAQTVDVTLVARLDLHGIEEENRRLAEKAGRGNRVLGTLITGAKFGAMSIS